MIKCADKRVDVYANKIKYNSYQVGEHMWVKVPQSWCTTKFSNGEVTKIINPQLILVDGIPRHVKDLQPCHCHHTGGRLWQHNVLWMKGRESSARQQRRFWAKQCTHWRSRSRIPFLPLQRSTRWKYPPLDYYLCDLEISGECSKRNHVCCSSKHARICLVCKMRSGREKQVIGKIEHTSSRSWIMFDIRTTYTLVYM